MPSLSVAPIADLAPRQAGLIPLWLVPLAGLIWLGALLAAGRLRGRRPGLAPEIVAVGGLLLAYLLFFWRPLLSTAEVPQGGGDLNSYFFPLLAFSAAQIRQGVLPLWNPALHGGMPQLANFQAAVLYPPNLIADVLARPFSYATLELLVLAHYLIASFAIYALARSLGLGRAPAVTSGIVFPYAGFLVAHLGHYSMLSTAVWVPLLLLAVRLMVLRASWLWAAATAVVIFLMTSAGHQQTLLYALTVALAWWLFWMARRYDVVNLASATLPAPVRGGAETALLIEPEPPKIQPRVAWPVRAAGFDLARAVAALVVGIGIAAPMLIPSLQLAARSVRSGLSLEQAGEFSVEPVALLHLIVPKAFGSNPTDYWGPFSNGEIWSYVGILTLILAAIALATRPRPVRLFLAGLALVALLYALGPFTPLQGWSFRFVPFYDLIRAPARTLVYVDLALALLAGFGMAELSGRQLRDERLERILSISLKALVGLLAGLVLIVIPLFYVAILGTNSPSNRPVIAVDGLILLAIWLGLSALLLWAVRRGALRGWVFALLAIALIVVDLFSATAGFNPTPDDLVAGYRHPQAVTYLQQQWSAQGPFRIESDTASWQPDLALVAGLNDVGGVFDPMEPADYESARQAATTNRALPLYNLLNVRYLITDDKATSPGAQFTQALKTDDGLVLWQNREALPRAWLSYSAQQVSLQTALAAIRGPSFDPRKTLYLTGSLAPVSSAGQGSVRITDYGANTVKLRVDGDAPAYLVLADVSYPGWVATVDGRSTPLATADGLFRAVRVPAGTHEVVFNFEPSMVRQSEIVAVLCLVALMVMAGLGIIAGTARRRSASGY